MISSMESRLDLLTADGVTSFCFQLKVESKVVMEETESKESYYYSSTQ